MRKRFLSFFLCGALGAFRVAVADPPPPADSAEAPLTVTSGYDVNGLVLWLAADSGVTLDKGTENGVAILADKTRNFILTPNSSGEEPILVPNGLNGRPVLRFNGGQSLYSPDDFGTALNRDMTIIIVAMTTTVDREEFPLYLGQNATEGANRALPILNGKFFFDGQFVGCYGQAAVTNTFVMEGASINSSLSHGIFYRNGAQVALGSVAEENKSLKRDNAFIGLSEGVTMGAATDPVCGWQGDIAEELVYNHQLSPLEMQTVWSYLSVKYGLQATTSVAVKP